MSFATVNGVTLRYSLEGGRQGLPLLFINSLGAELCIWDELLAALALTGPVLRYDERGHGLSECPAGPYSIADHAEDLAGLLDHLRMPSTVVVGISLGGMIALDFASRWPERVRGLLLCDTGAKIGTPGFWQGRIDLVCAQGLAGAAETILTRWFTPSFAKDHPAEYVGYRTMLSRVPLAGYVASCAAIRDADLRPLTERITAKTLVLCGAEDQATPPALARELAGSIKDAHLAIIDQAAHFPTIEQPVPTAAVIRTFLKELADGR